MAAVDCKSIVKQIPVRQGFRQNHVSISFKDMVLGFFRFRDRGRIGLGLITYEVNKLGLITYEVRYNNTVLICPLVSTAGSQPVPAFLHINTK